MGYEDVDAERPEESSGSRGRHNADHASQDPDATSSEDDLGSRDDAIGDANGSLTEQEVADELAEAEELLEGEIEEVGEIIDGELVEPQPGRKRRRLIHESWKAPLPPPAALREYEDICPGAADRVLRMAERSLDLRDKRETILQTAVEGEVHVQTTLAEGDRDALQRGQYLAAAISAMVALLSFAGMFLTPWAAVGFVVPLAQVATTLVRTISDGHNDGRTTGESSSEAD